MVFPPGVGPTPVEGMEVTRPLWLFRCVPMESRWGAKAILRASGALFILLALVPFIDRTDNRWWRRRPVEMVALAFVFGGAVALTVLTERTPRAAQL